MSLEHFFPLPQSRKKTVEQVKRQKLQLVLIPNGQNEIFLPVK
jgi:hypothetical protein